jgi:hypothetical protein
MEKLKFYSLTQKKAFLTDKYKTVNKSGRKFAIAKDSKGKECWRVMGKAKK